MADYITTGYKTVRCKACGHSCIQLFQTTIFKCDHCGSDCFAPFSGTVIDKHGDRIY